MMQNYMCATCGVQYAATEEPPEGCKICQDERQYIGLDGQKWTTLDAIKPDRHNTFTPLVDSLTSIVTEPSFGIGQRAHVVQTPAFNMLWDCISLIDDRTVEKINAMGGIKAIALSHPHYYSTIVNWSQAFGGIPIYIHAADREWVTQPDPAIQFWEGETLQLADGLTLINCGGHFAGSSVLHWRDGNNGTGVLLTGDTIDVVSDRRYVSFMYSYPNLIPLPASKIRRIAASVEPYNFDQIYDAFGHNIVEDGKQAVRRSADRYIQSITEQG